MLTFRFEGFKSTFESWKKVVYIGIPAAVTQILIPVSMGVITRLIATQGNAAIAAFGVCSRIEMFVLSPIVALGAVITPFTGQNYGAGKLERVKEGLKFSSVFSLTLSAVIWVTFHFFGESAGALFNDSPEVYETVGLYLAIVALSYGFHGISMVAASVFNALNKPFAAMLINVFKLIVLLVPLAWLGLKYWQLKGIFTGIGISYFIAGIGSWMFLYLFLQRQPVGENTQS
jgi:Na+-driven multidrug efflux pump